MEREHTRAHQNAHSVGVGDRATMATLAELDEVACVDVVDAAEHVVEDDPADEGDHANTTRKQKCATSQRKTRRSSEAGLRHMNDKTKKK